MVLLYDGAKLKNDALWCKSAKHLAICFIYEASINLWCDLTTLHLTDISNLKSKWTTYNNQVKESVFTWSGHRGHDPSQPWFWQSWQSVVGLQTSLYLSMITMRVRDNRGTVNSIVYNVFIIYIHNIQLILISCWSDQI